MGLVEPHPHRRRVHLPIGWELDSQSLTPRLRTPEATLAVMKAWQLTDTKGIGSYALNDIEEPQPGPGEVRIKISHSALNHLDLWVSQGLPAPEHFPHTTGADGAGRVDAIGAGVA